MLTGTVTLNNLVTYNNNTQFLEYFEVAGFFVLFCLWVGFVGLGFFLVNTKLTLHLAATDFKAQVLIC